MSQFPSEREFSSWAGLCPGNNRSAGKSKSSHTTGGNPWLRSTLTECAWAAANTKGCFLKEKFWRVANKHGGKKPPAIVAVAHSLLLLVHRVLLTGQPYCERDAPPLTGTQRQRIIRHHLRRLGKLGVATGSCLPVARRTAATPRPKRRKTPEA